jgi:hypothetical protein
MQTAPDSRVCVVIPFNKALAVSSKAGDFCHELPRASTHVSNWVSFAMASVFLAAPTSATGPETGFVSRFWSVTPSIWLILDAVTSGYHEIRMPHHLAQPVFCRD